MHTSLFLLYSLTFIPVTGAHAQPINTAREAFFRQTGIADDWHKVRRAAEKKVPRQLSYAGVIYKIVHKREMQVKTKGQVFTIRRNGVEAALRWEW